MVSEIDLNRLPSPRVVEELDYEVLFERQQQKFQSRWQEVRLANPDLGLPPYDVQMLETDPPVIINEAESYRELLIRQRINEAAKANLLAFATGSDLEHLAAFYEVTRMAGEDDARLKRRVILAIQGRSTGGTEPRYKLIAMSADIRVDDAIVFTLGRSPVINVAIFSTYPDGIADEYLIEIVDTALQAPGARMVNDTIVVRSAIQRVIDIVADVWLLPDAPQSLLETMEASLRTDWTATRALGRDFVDRWWTAHLMLDGVHKVTPISPADVIVPPDEAVSIGTVTLNFKGRAF